MASFIVSSVVALGLNYALHTGASLAHHHFCVAQSIWDIPYSIVATASPVCSVLVSTIQTTQSNFATILTTSITASIVYTLGNPTRLAPIPKPAPVRAEEPTLGA